MEVYKNAARLTFWDWVTEAFNRRKVRVSPDLEKHLEDYLVTLLERFLEQEKSGSVLSEPLRAELQKSLNQGGIARFTRIRQIGDASLFTAGVLGPHLGRSLVGIKHYVDVGESAYRFLFLNLDKNNNLSVVYHELARNLGSFVKILNEISAEHMFPADLENILLVYERYVATRNKEDARWLIEHGVALLPRPDPNKLIVQ